jgi:hypothetical protein
MPRIPIELALVKPPNWLWTMVRQTAAYSAEVDRLFRRNVTGDSAESALQLISTRVGHVQSRFGYQTRGVCRVQRQKRKTERDRLTHGLRLCRGFRFGDLLGGFTLAHRFFGLEMDPMRPVDQAIQDGVCERRITDVVMPVIDGQL